MLKKLLFTFFIILLIILAFIYFQRKETLPTVVQKDDNYIIEKEKISPLIVQKTDNYIIGLVGISEFKNNYKLDIKSSESCTDNVPYGCFLKYKFLPGDIYGGSEYVFYYNAQNKSVEITNNNIPITLPSCEIDINKCQFKILVNELKEIAKKENLDDKNFRLVLKEDKILIEVSHCDLNTMENRNKILVDPVNGDIIWRGPNLECQGIV